VNTKKAQGTHKPGGGTPPSIDTGSFVQWGSNRGRVDLVVTNGKVPGVDDDVEGSKDSPAARIVVWEPDGDGYKATRQKVAKMVHTLKRIPPLTSGKSLRGGDLIGLLADHEATVADADGTVPDTAHVTGVAVKTVYDRGLAAWPGDEHTTLTREEWATSRVKAFLATAAGDDPGDYSRDLALLSKAHPAHPAHAEHKAANDGDETVEVDVSEVEKHLEMFADAD
jgi:hypothetical protein